MKNIIVTVLMPVYNADKFLLESIDSIFNQTYKNFIFLIVNDGSIDKSEDIILKKQKEDSRILYLKNEKNRGIVSALNKGIDIVSTKYIVRMDADDISTPDRIEKLVDYMEGNSDIGVCSSYMKAFGTDNDVWKTPLLNNEINAGLLFRTTMAHAASIIRTSIFSQNKIRYSSLVPHQEDYLLWHTMHENGILFSCIPKVLYFVRREDHNVTVTNRNSFLERNRIIHRIILTDFGIKFSDMELRLHSGFTDKNLLPTYNNIMMLNKWYNRILKHNVINKHYPNSELINVIEYMKNNLFYKMVDEGYMPTIYYWLIIRKPSKSMLLYFFKFFGKKIIFQNE